MLARGCISDNWHLPDTKLKQIFPGMRRWKPACNALATASAANNIPSMQKINEAALQLVKNWGKKLTKTIETNNHIPPPGPGVPPVQVILNPILLPLNAPPQCQWTIATAELNAGSVVQNAPWPMLLGQPKTYMLLRRILKGRTIPHPRAWRSPSSEQCSRPGNYSWANPRASHNGYSRYSTDDATCCPCESPSVEQSHTPRPSDPASSEQSSPGSECPNPDQPATHRPHKSPSSEQCFTHRPGKFPSTKCSPLGAELSSRSGEYVCNEPSGSSNVYPWYASAGPTCLDKCPSFEQSCGRSESLSSKQSCQRSESPSSKQSCLRCESPNSNQSCPRSESRISEQSCHPGNYSCVNPSCFPNGHSRDPTRDARCCCGGYPMSCGTNCGGFRV